MCFLLCCVKIIWGRWENHDFDSMVDTLVAQIILGGELPEVTLGGDCAFMTCFLLSTKSELRCCLPMG